MNEYEYELARQAGREAADGWHRSLARLNATMAGFTERLQEERLELEAAAPRPEDADRLPMPAAWWAAHAEAPLRETLVPRIPDVDPQGRPGYYLGRPLTWRKGDTTVKWPVIRVQDPGESECIGYVVRLRDDFSAHTLHGYLGSTSDRHTALIMVAIRDDRDDRDPDRRVSEFLVLGTVEIDDKGDAVWPLLRRGERVGLIREVRKPGENPSRYYTAYVRGRARTGPFATLDEALEAVREISRREP